MVGSHYVVEYESISMWLFMTVLYLILEITQSSSAHY